MTRDQHDANEGNCPLGCPWCEAEREEARRAHELGLCDDDCPICEAQAYILDMFMDNWLEWQGGTSPLP